MLKLRDYIRPIFGLFMIQPVVLLYLWAIQVDDLWREWLSVGWVLQIMITAWLIPVYAGYEQVWNQWESETEWPHEGSQ